MSQANRRRRLARLEARRGGQRTAQHCPRCRDRLTPGPAPRPGPPSTEGLSEDAELQALAEWQRTLPRGEVTGHCPGCATEVLGPSGNLLDQALQLYAGLDLRRLRLLCSLPERAEEVTP